MIIESPAFEQNQTIPQRYTCDGEDLSPPLTFSGLPQGTASLALIVDDPDAPRGTFDHWIVWNIPSAQHDLKEGAHVPKEGAKGFGDTRYRGPCPPKGKPHHYFFKLYALDVPLNLPAGSTKAAVEEAMEGHILGKAQLIGLYQR
jgi:Raf kinase inhibitor-like YbhB/YbcL family protein